MSIYEVQNMISNLFYTTGLMYMSWKFLAMWVISGVFLYLAIVKNFEPLL